MKKFIAGLLMGFLLTFSVAAYAAGDIRLVINGKDITDTMDVKPQVIDGRTMVPAKYVAEALGATVTWDSAKSSVIITSGQARVDNRPLGDHNSNGGKDLRYGGERGDVALPGRTEYGIQNRRLLCFWPQQISWINRFNFRP